MSKIPDDWKLSAIKQQFSLPEASVFYMAKNPPSPEVYEKLIRCCKYFWLKNPVITLNYLGRFYDEKYWVTHKINGFPELKKLKIESFKEKLWINWKLTVYNDLNQFLASSLIPRVYRCDLKELMLAHLILSFDEFQKFTSSGTLESLDLHDTIVKNDDRTVVTIEKFIEILSNLEAFVYGNIPGDEGFQAITSETAAHLIEIPHFPKIKYFVIRNIQESFDFEVFFAVSKVRS